MMKENKPITRKELRVITGCPGYTINYLNDCGRLPIIEQSKGKGYPNKYDPKAIDIIKKHLNKQLENDNNV